MFDFLFPWTSSFLHDCDECNVVIFLALALDAVMWFLAVAFCWLWLPMLLLYLVAKSIEKLVGYIKKREACK